MAVSQVKLRILYIIKILLEKTDEKHTMSASDIDKELRRYGMSIDRKTVYNDIETLKAFGMDILQARGANSGYYIGRRDFELPELKLLVDAGIQVHQPEEIRRTDREAGGSCGRARCKEASEECLHL